jgi:hypothetical protein
LAAIEKTEKLLVRWLSQTEAMMSGTYYVYSLKDTSINPARPFYIAKGTGTRAGGSRLAKSATYTLPFRQVGAFERLENPD